MEEKKENNILKKFKGIFKKILAFTGSAATLLLPGCADAQQQDNKQFNDDERKSFVDTLRENVPTTESELSKLVDTTTLDNYIDVTSGDTTNEIITSNPTQEKSSYDTLLNNFNNEFNKKGFSDMTYKYMKAIFDSTYENYDKWRQINKDLPTKEKYINDNIIKNIKYINDIHFYSVDSKEAQESLNNGYGLAYTNSDMEITVIYDESNKENFDKEVIRLAHELEHIDQKSIAFNSDYFEKYPYMRDILVEGGASSKMKYMASPRSEKTTADFIESGRYTLEYKNDTRRKLI